MKKWFGNLPLRAKLVLSGFVPSIAVLLAAALAFIAFDIYSFKTSALGNLSGAAHFIALTTRAAVQFNQPEYAEKILHGLASNDDVSAACIYDEAQNVFARYPASLSDSSFPDLATLASPKPPPGRIWVFAPIHLDGKKIGSVFIDAGYLRLWRRLWIVAAGAVAVLLILSFGAFALSARLQRHVSKPLTKLAATAHRISAQKDYSLRVEPEPGPEFSPLTDAFNHMLSQIQARDAELLARAQELEAANKELGAFTYTVSHDLRSPLRSVAGFSHILETQYAHKLDGEGHTLLRRIRAGAQRMGQLIDDLLSFAHLGAEPVKKEPLDPASIARKVFAELASQDKNRSPARLLVPMPPGHAHPPRREQVYVNLLSNALKYSRNPPSPRVHVGSTTHQGKTTYFVKDNGVGFDMRHAPQLFQVFRRLHKSDEFEGTGVGLAIVHRIITRHGGRIWPESQPGQGSTFHFTLN